MLIKCVYYECVKFFMNTGYNFKLECDKIELFIKKEDSVIINFEDIKRYEISKYLYKFLRIFNFSYSYDTNMKKDVYIIRLYLCEKDDKNYYKRKSLYYNLFNLRRSKKMVLQYRYMKSCMIKNQIMILHY